MKKLVLLVMSLTLLLSTTVSVSADTEGPRERSDGKRGPGIEGIFETYYPEGLSEFEALQEEHQAFHEGRKALRDEHRADLEAEKAAIKAAVESGEMTQEEARAFITARKAEQEPIKEALNALRDAKKEELESIKASREILKANILEALKSDPVDTATIAAHLIETTELLEAHIAIDYKYADLVFSTISGL